VAVAYARGSLSCALTAIPENELRTDLGNEGLVVTVSRRAWLIRLSDLELDGAAALPERGDEITEERDGIILTWQVLPGEGNEPAYEYTGTDRSEVRVRALLKSRVIGS
jgi:hypothetical protein